MTRPAHLTDRCPFSWAEGEDRVRCFRGRGHDGRHIGRHPTIEGEVVFHARDEEDQDGEA